MVELTVRLNDDGTVTWPGDSAAAAWCDARGKKLRMQLGEGDSPGDTGVTFGDGVVPAPAVVEVPRT